MWCSLCGEGLGTLAFSDGEEAAAMGRVCDLCAKVPPPFQRAVAFGAYRGTLRALIHAMKYDGMMPIADELGARLAESICGLECTAPSEMLVVPVPLHRAKRSLRRFNHAEVLARSALRKLRGSKPDWKLVLALHLLERQRATGSQAGLTPHQRRANLRGAFLAPSPGELRDAHVLLIDDIYTTGATARACSKALLKAGATSVWVATVARAQFEHITRPQLQRMEAASCAGGVAEDLPMEEDVAFWDAATKVGPAIH